MKNRLQNRFAQSRFTRVDIAALFLFAAVWAYYIIMVRYGFGTADENYYWSIPQRLMQGDRLLVDEWCVGQFFPVFLYLPYRLYLAVNGSAAGIILFSRYLFLAVNAVFYWTMYALLRRYRWPALIGSLLFSAHVPLFIFSCSYYTMAVRLVMLVCLVLFRDKKTPLSLLLAGVLLSCAVLNQPGFALLYVGFTVLVWVRFFRQRKGKRFLDDFAFCLETRSWKYMSISVAVCAAVFLCWLFARSGLQDALRSVPYTLIDPEYDFSAGGNARGFFLQKLLAAVQIYGLYCTIPALLIVGLSIAYACGLFRKNRETVRRVLFGLACAVWILSCIPSFRVSEIQLPDSFSFLYPAPMFWFGFVCYLLGSKKNKRFLLFWVVGLCASLSVDFFSDIAFSLGAPISYFADLIFFFDLIRELFPEPLFKLPSRTGKRRRTTRGMRTGAKKKHGAKKEKKARRDLPLLWFARATCVCFAVWAAFLFTFDHTALPERSLFGASLSSMHHVCTQGPWRSLHVSQTPGIIYDSRLADVDRIKAKQPKNLYVCGLTPDTYLYADLPYATYCSWSLHETPYLNREILYWKLHPDRLPECIYVPFYDTGNPLDEVYEQSVEDATLTWIHESLDPLCAYTAEQGQGGYILYVSQWHLNAEAAK